MDSITHHRRSKPLTTFSVAALFLLFLFPSDIHSQTAPNGSRTVYDYLAAGNTDRAVRELRLSIRKEPLNMESHFLLASLLAQKGETDEAIIGFERVLAINPANADALYNLGTLLLWRGQPVPAAKVLEKAISFRPDHVPSYINIGKAYFLAGLPDLAAAAYQEALRRSPDNTVALNNFRLLIPFDKSVPGRATPLPESSISPEQPTPSPTLMNTPDKQADDLREIVRDLTYVKVERRGGRLVLTGWTGGSNERAMLDRILAKSTDVLDLTTDDSGDAQRMIEIDALLFTVSGVDQQDIGYNFLNLIDVNFNFFATDNTREGTGFNAPPALTGVVDGLSQQGWIFAAAAKYSVNIANADSEQVAVLARPHLTTLSGTPASFLAGGELVYEVSGINSGDIKPYPFGTMLKVTPTLLRSPSRDGSPRVHLKIEAGRTSILGILENNAGNQGNFQKVTVTSEAVLNFGQTLILSGLSQRESRTTRTGVPVLMEIPILKYFFSTRSKIDSESAVVILLTPRDPAFLDAKTEKEIKNFVEQRVAFLEARRGTPDDMVRFRQRYPDSDKLPPNWLASHLYLLEKSALYRSVSVQDIKTEGLDLELLGPVPKKKPPPK